MKQMNMLQLAKDFAEVSGMLESFEKEYAFQREYFPVNESIFKALSSIDLWDNFVLVRNTQPGWNYRMRTGMEIIYNSGEIVREANEKMDFDESLSVNESAAWLLNISEIWVTESQRIEG